MVLKKGVRGLLDGSAGKVALAGAAVTAAGGVAVALLLAGVTPTSLLLNGLALAGGGAAWMRARTAHRVAEQTSSDLDRVAGRLIQLEHRLLQAAAAGTDKGLRSSVDEVTGEISLLGGIIRDLAETVAVQDREVADLKERMKRPAARPDSAEAAAPGPPRSPVRNAPARVVEKPAPAQPEPSLLPTARREPTVPAAVPGAETERMAAILKAFEADRLELHLQPIVSLPQRKVRFYEALARLRLSDETILVPAEFMPLIERHGHAAELDRRVFGRAIAIARHLMSRGSEAIVSVNISPRSLEEPGFLRSLGRILDAYPDTAGRVVLELSQRCLRTLDAERAGGLASLRDKGMPFSLDRASDLRLDPLALADRGVRFVKLPADLMIAADQGSGLDIEVADLSSVLRRAGIRLIAERVEREEMVPDLIDLDVPLAQGFVFAPPRAVRADVLNPPLAATGSGPSAAPADPAPPAPSPPPPAAAEERLPFRSFLRRAG